MGNKKVRFKLVDGSEMDVFLVDEISDLNSYIQSKIIDNGFIKVQEVNYGNLFGDEYIVAKNIISYRIHKY